MFVDNITRCLRTILKSYLSLTLSSGFSTIFTMMIMQGFHLIIVTLCSLISRFTRQKSVGSFKTDVSCIMQTILLTHWNLSFHHHFVNKHQRLYTFEIIVYTLAYEQQHITVDVEDPPFPVQRRGRTGKCALSSNEVRAFFLPAFPPKRSRYHRPFNLALSGSHG